MDIDLNSVNPMKGQESGCVKYTPNTQVTPTPQSNSADFETVSNAKWASWQINHPFGIPTRRSDEIYRMFSPQMTDAFRHEQVSGPWTVSSTAARQPNFCHPPYGLPGTVGELNNNFDAFYSDVFLNDFVDVDTSQYNVGGLCRNPYGYYPTSHRHLMLSSTSAVPDFHSVGRGNDLPTTLTRSTTLTHPDLPLHPQHLPSNIDSKLYGRDIQSNLLQHPETHGITEYAHQPRCLVSSDVIRDDHQFKDYDNQNCELMKRLLGEDIDDYVRLQPMKDYIEEYPLKRSEEGRDSRTRQDLSLNLELKNGGLKVLQIKDLQYMKKEDLEDLKKEFQEHQQMWKMELCPRGQKDGDIESSLKTVPDSAEGVLERGSIDRAFPCTSKGSADVHKNSQETEEKTAISLDLPHARDEDLLVTGQSSLVKHPNCDRMVLSIPDFDGGCNKTKSLTPDSVMPSSNYTVLQERPMNIVTSSKDQCTPDALAFSEAQPPSTHGTEVRRCPSKNTETTSSDHVTSTTDSGGNKRKQIRRAVDEPRRPKNGFIRFSIEHRHKIAAQHPKLDNREVSRILGCKWRKMTADDKKCYEEEFEKDIQSIREEHPEWRYAPAKSLSEELIEPMPSRLRPRNSLKRKFPYKIRTYNRRQPKINKKKTTSSPESDRDLPSTWIQCDLCGKWRCVPVSIPRDQLFDVWFCYCNPDPRYNSCSISENLDTKQPISPPCSSLPSPPSSSTSPSCYSTYSNSKAHVLFREPSW